MASSASKENADHQKENFIEKILARRERDGKVEYLLKRTGEENNIWKAKENVICLKLIEEFEKDKQSELPDRSPEILNDSGTWHLNNGKRQPESLTTVKPKKLKRSDTSNEEELKNDENRRKRLDKRRPRISGFDRGLEAEKIMGISDLTGELIFLIKWRGTEEMELVPAAEAHVKCPQLVIQFYEERIAWHSPGMS